MALQIIGAGFGRTGTASLKLALEQLGFGPCYHMTEVFEHPEAIPLWVDAINGNPDWDTIFNGYASCVDFPACTHWRTLMEFYPDAKVILSMRDASRWFDSVNETIMSPKTVEFTLNSPLSEMIKRNIYDLFDGRIHEREHMIECFNAHVQQVKDAVPAERLLVFEAKMGWEPICKFLGVDAPDHPYPHVNTREDFAKLFDTAGSHEENHERMQEAAKSVYKSKS
jgi:Sulfotransferase domain